MNASPQERSSADDFLLLILSSPSGAGKTTLTRRLLATFPELTFSVSHTTRTPRIGEVDGRDYHFVDRPRFEAMMADGAFLEWAEVHGNLYGTASAEVDRARGRPTCRGMLFDIDYQGARQIRAKRPHATTVFVLPPSMQELERRLRGRASESEDTLARRFRAARNEIEHYALFDYLVVNDRLDDAFDELRSILVTERVKRTRRAELAERLLREGTLG